MPAVVMIPPCTCLSEAILVKVDAVSFSVGEDEENGENGSGCENEKILEVFLRRLRA